MVFVSNVVAANISPLEQLELCQDILLGFWLSKYLCCYNVHLPVYVTYESLYSPGCIYTTVMPEKLYKSWCKYVANEKPEIYLPFSLYSYTVFLNYGMNTKALVLTFCETQGSSNQ